MAFPQSHSDNNNMTMPHPRVPIRSTTFDHEGWMNTQQQTGSGMGPLGEGLAEQVVCPPPPKPSSPSIILAHSCWHTDIVTFCSHVSRDPLLRRAHVTEVQNRKSRTLPYLQEYILLFFVVGRRQFVVRIDHATCLRHGAKQPEPLLGQPSAQMSQQQVTVYQVESGGTPWFDDDGTKGSELIAALSTWSNLGSSGVPVVSHHLSTARDVYSGQGPSLHDVCRLLEAVVLEAPTSYFKPASSYITSRSVLLVIRDCFPQDLACTIGEERELVSASMLDEPAWASALRWYLPFTLLALLVYAGAVIGVHLWVAHLLGVNSESRDRMNVLETVDRCMRSPNDPDCTFSGIREAPWKNALRVMLHLVLDLPFPAGIFYTWLVSIDMKMDALVKRISARFFGQEGSLSDAGAVVKTWFGTYSKPWFQFTFGLGAGCIVGLALFLGILLGHGIVAMVLLLVVVSSLISYALPHSDDDLEWESDDGLQLLDCELTSRSDSELSPPVAGPSSPH